MSETVPLSLALDQIRAYRYAFLEAVERANRAIRQRDYYRAKALRATCDFINEAGECPEDAYMACPFPEGYCDRCVQAVDGSLCDL